MNFLKKILKKYKHEYRDNNIYSLEHKIGYDFNDPEILQKAITHKSFLSEPDKNYERLEFLGDAILDGVISEWLFKKYSKLDEGGLTKKRSSLVNSTFLSMIGKKFNLIHHINADSGVNLNDSKVLFVNKNFIHLKHTGNIRYCAIVKIISIQIQLVL